jgi:hypothetical protein
MADRPRITIPFGGGLDRETGLLQVDQASFADLRNWHLRAGKMLLRGGLPQLGDVLEGSIVVAVHPIRARSLGAVLTYDSVAGDVLLHVVSTAGLLLNTVGLPGAPGPGLDPPPRFILADVYKWLFIAHDQPNFSARLPTFTFDTAAFAFLGLLGGTYGFAGLGQPVAFRGVKRHFQYLIGWGWGTVADPDRPEYLRISLPSDPLTFDPQHYFLVGSQGEPIVMCDPASTVLALKKLSESYQLIGTDRPTFGVVPLDPAFGQMAARLSVTVGGVNYFWSESGPRMTGGGPSEDLELPLDLGGPAPDALAVADLARGFAVYDHDHREVLFIFGRWAYVLHLDNAMRWSYREFGTEIHAAGVFYESEVGALPTTGGAIATLVSHVSSTDTTQTWAVTIAGATTADDAIEFWVREKAGPFANQWAFKATTLIGGRTAFTVEVPNLLVGLLSDWAVRISRVGAPEAIYAGNDPMVWPAASRQIGNPDAATTIPAPVIDTALVFQGTPDELRLTIAFFEGDHELVTHEVEADDGAGGWTALGPLLLDTHLSTPQVIADVEALAGLTRDVRIRADTTDADPSAWTTIPGVVFVDPLADLITALGSYDGVYLADRGISTESSGHLDLHMEWRGTKSDGTAATTLVSPNGGPTNPSGPPRVHFNGVSAASKLNQYLQTAGPIGSGGITFLAVVRCTETDPGIQRILFQTVPSTGGVITIGFRADGILEYNHDGTVSTFPTVRRGDWVVVGFTQQRGVAFLRGFDGGTPIANAGASSQVENPTVVRMPGDADAGTQFFGDVYAMVFSSIFATDAQMADAYDALVALAAAAGIVVTN